MGRVNRVALRRLLAVLLVLIAALLFFIWGRMMMEIPQRSIANYLQLFWYRVGAFVGCLVLGFGAIWLAIRLWNTSAGSEIPRGLPLRLITPSALKRLGVLFLLSAQWFSGAVAPWSECRRKVSASHCRN
jgi:hypothetical protein